jgi:hypothetical protein
VTQMTNSVFDPEMVQELRELTTKIWNLIPPNRKASISYDEVARLVMLLATAGVVDHDEIIRSIISGDAQ